MPTKTQKPAVSDEYEAVVNGAEETYEEVNSGDFPPVHDFNETNELKGTYVECRIINVKDKDRTLQVFDVNGEEITAWGCAILDNRLKGLEGKRVKIVKTGKKLSTKSGGFAWEFQVFVARAALNTASPSSPVNPTT